MKKLVIAVALFCLFFSGVQAEEFDHPNNEQHVDRPGPPPGEDGGRGIVKILKDEKLDLSKKQKKEIKKLFKEHKKSSVKQREKIDKHMLMIDKSFDPKTFDPDNVRKSSKMMGSLMQEMMDNRLEFMLSIIALLDEKQKEYFIPRIKNHMKGMMGPPGGKPRGKKGKKGEKPEAPKK